MQVIIIIIHDIFVQLLDILFVIYIYLYSNFVLFFVKKFSHNNNHNNQ